MYESESKPSMYKTGKKRSLQSGRVTGYVNSGKMPFIGSIKILKVREIK